MSLSEKLAKLTADVEELKAAAEDVRADLADLAAEMEGLLMSGPNELTAIDWKSLMATIMQMLQMLLPLITK